MWVESLWDLRFEMQEWHPFHPPATEKRFLQTAQAFEPWIWKIFFALEKKESSDILTASTRFEGALLSLLVLKTFFELPIDLKERRVQNVTMEKVSIPSDTVFIGHGYVEQTAAEL